MSWNCLKKYSKNFDTPVGAGEDQPIIGVQLQQGIDNVLAAGGGFDTDGGHFQHLGAELEQSLAELAGLVSGASHHDTLAKERPALKPVELLPKIDHLADDGHGGGTDALARGDIGDGAQSPGNGLLMAGGAPANQGNGCVPGAMPWPHESFGNQAHAIGAHHDDLGAGGLRNVGPIDRGFLFGRIFVAGNQSEAGTEVAVR